MGNSTQIGDVLVCADCGAEVMVTKVCKCEKCEIVCCGKPMQPKPKERRSCCCG